jgi:hypothetical protein
LRESRRRETSITHIQAIKKVASLLVMRTDCTYGKQMAVKFIFMCQ